MIAHSKKLLHEHSYVGPSHPSLEAAMGNCQKKNYAVPEASSVQEYV